MRDHRRDGGQAHEYRPRWPDTGEFYISEIAKRQSFPPFAFMTNGESIYFLET